MNNLVKIKHTNENMPYEKFLQFGPYSLTDSELLAIILRTGTYDKTALQLAEEILSTAKGTRTGLLGLHDISIHQLMKIKGIGEVKAIKIKCIAELSKRISKTEAKKGVIVNDPKTVAQYFMEELRHRKTECVVLVSLDTKGQIINDTILSSGSIKMSVISPREVFLEALKNEAVNIILIHNHPSGNTTPSKNDIELTKHIKNMGISLDISLLDKMIIGDNSYTSFKEVSLL